MICGEELFSTRFSANQHFVKKSYLCYINDKNMPVSKDAMARYRIIDRLLADPNKDYTTEEILHYVNRECPHVSKRMIQKDIKALEEEPFCKELVRNKGGRGTVRYVDQSSPLFYQQLSWDEEELLREMLRSLGQFDGLDNFMWLELLKKKLDLGEDASQLPVISFSRNEGLKVPETLLGRLFSAISKKKVIRVKYTPFGKLKREITVYPYQLKQYNDRWHLLCTPLADGVLPYNPKLIINLPLDRIDGSFEFVEGEPFVETPVDIKARFDEIIGVTLYQDEDIEEVLFAVSPSSTPYVRSKAMHITQIEYEGETLEEYRAKYPSLKDWSFFSIECRQNHELYARFASYGKDVVLINPIPWRNQLARILSEAAANYAELGKD